MRNGEGKTKKDKTEIRLDKSQATKEAEEAGRGRLDKTAGRDRRSSARCNFKAHPVTASPSINRIQQKVAESLKRPSRKRLFYAAERSMEDLF